MKWYCKIGIIAVIAILFYLIGNWIPIDYLKPEIENSTLKSSEYYSLIARGVSAFITFLAVVVALFKDDFRKLWNYSKLEARLSNEAGITEQLEVEKKETNSEIETKNYKAEKYESVIIIENRGNVTAKNCEVYIEKIYFTNNEYVNKQNIPINNSSIKWNSENEIRLHIPPKGKKTVTVIKLLSPKAQSLPGGKDSFIDSQLYIGENLNPLQYNKGKWEIHLIIYSDDTMPVSSIVYLDWNGKWEQRFSEIKNCLTINLQ